MNGVQDEHSELLVEADNEDSRLCEEDAQAGHQPSAVDTIRRSPMYAALLAQRRRIRIENANENLYTPPKTRRTHVNTVSPSRTSTDMSRFRSRDPASKNTKSNHVRFVGRPPERAASGMNSIRRRTEELLRDLVVYSNEELRQMDRSLNFEIPDSAQLRTMTEQAVVKMNVYQHGELACAVCEMLHEDADLNRQKLSPQLLQAMRRCLAVPEGTNIPKMIVEQYCASEIDARLHGLLLYPPAVSIGDEDVTLVDLCGTCLRYLSCSSESKPPTLSIANGNYIGRMPAKFSGLTRTDEQSIALVVPCVSLSTLTGGSCKVLKSHHYIVKNTEGPIIDMLPRDLTGTVRVTMVGSMTSAQRAACRKRYELNIPLCRDVLQFLAINNKLYQKQRSRLNLNCDSFAGTVRTELVIDRTSNSENPIDDERITQHLRDDSTYSSFGSTVLDGIDSTIEQTEISSSKLLLQNYGSTTDVLVRKSNAYANTRNWGSVAEMFPTLFPGGCGSPDEPRLRKLSLRKWILRCLRLPGHLFERHYAFLLLAFDFVALRNARRALYIKLKVSTSALVAGNISRENVLHAVQYYNHLTASQERGVQPRPPPDSIQQIIDLRKGLNSGESASFGSDINRMRGRHKLFGYLQRFGTLQLFLTIAPDSSGTFTIAVKSGSVKRSVLDEANLQLLPNRAERKRLAGQHPMECARYFERVMDTFISDILGWDSSRVLPKRGGGVFGVVRAFGAAVETQQAGDLHAHFAIWLHGFPQTSFNLHKEYRDNVVFRSRLDDFIDTMVTTDIPAFHGSIECPIDSGELESVEVGLEAFRRPIPGQRAPVTSRCTRCFSEFRDKDIINAGIDKLATECNTTLTDGYIDFLKCRAPINDEPGSPKSRLAQTLVIRDVQVHFWTHSRSCFKVTSRTPKGSVCRFFKPDNISTGTTSINGKGEVVLHRDIGSEYLNPYNIPILTVFKCNHDVRFVFGSDKRSVAAYVCKYCMKMQKKVENQLALSLAAFARGVKSADSMPPDTSSSARGYRILCSMLYSITNAQEIAATMAALLLLRESPFYFSHDVVFVNPSCLLNDGDVMEDVTVFPEALLSGKKTKLKDRSLLLRQYWARQPALENTCFAETCENYFPETSVLEESNSIIFAERDTRKVMIIAGKPIPDITSPLEAESIDFYYKALLVLFRPHREDTFVGSSCDPRQVYQQFMTSGPCDAVESCRKFEEYWQDFHRSNHSNPNGEESPENELIRNRKRNSVDDVDTRYPDVECESCNSDDETICGEAGVLPTSIFDFSVDTSIDAAHEVVSGTLNLPEIIENVSHQYSQREILPPPNVPADLSIDNYLVRVADDTPDEADVFNGTSIFLKQFRTVNTQIEMFSECFQPVPWQSPSSDTSSVSQLKTFPTIAQTSCAFRLNFWQHTVFEMTARHLLYAYLQDIEAEAMISLHGGSREPYHLKDQFIGYLGGEAGTGKSTVIHALLTFSEKWGRSGTIETTAFTGVAAANINGKTLHSSRNLQVVGFGQRAPPTLRMKAEFCKVVLVIIDEVSMTDQPLLGSTDIASRDMATQPGHLMGGKHVLLCGDWLQLPPVRGTPCYSRPPDTAARYHHAGHRFYCAINFVVFLTENMRSQEDPEYADILSALRWGRTTSHHLDLLNARVLKTPTQVQGAASTSDFFRPVIVATNKLRCSINRILALKTNSDATRLYEIQASASSRSQHIFERILNVNEDLTDGVSMRLCVSIGMPVMITRKHPALSKFSMVTNGTLATVVGFSPPICDSDTIAVETPLGTVHRLPKAPELIFLRLSSCKNVLVSGFDPGVIGVPVLSAQVKLSKMPNLSQASITVKQFPIVPAFSCTTEKLQGKTCHSGIIVSRLSRHGGVPSQTIYVALSRATTLDKLTLTEPITLDYLAKFAPDPAAVAEMQRLMAMIQLPPYMSNLEHARFRQWLNLQNAA